MGFYGEAVKNDSEIEYENKILYIVESIFFFSWINFNVNICITVHREKYLFTRWCLGNFKQDPSHTVYNNKLWMD